MEKWIQNAFKHSPHKGALHRALHIPIDEKIPIHLLKHIVSAPLGMDDIIYGHHVTITKHLKKQAQFLLNVDRARK